MNRQYFVYIMTNTARTLYTGVTNDLERRVYEHKMKLFPGFTARYSLDRLVYYEAGENVLNAIEREKQIKGWLRSKKIKLIESVNPEWKDLSSDWRNQYLDAT
jgi:putative endonuclease